MRRLAIAALAVLLASGTSRGASDQTVILIPTLYTGPGAFESTWWTAVALNNYSAVSFRSPAVQFAVVQCGIPEGCIWDEIPPGQIGGIVSPRPANGLLLYADRAVADDLTFVARFGSGVFRLTNGTELPVVREGDFRQKPLHLPNVNLHLTYTPVRTTMRIYGMEARVGTRVRIEVRSWDTPSGPPLASREIVLDVPESPSTPPIFPAFAQVHIQEAFPFELLRGSSFNLSVVPLPFASGEVPKIWAFITTTENSTQQVTVQQPQ